MNSEVIEQEELTNDFAEENDNTEENILEQLDPTKNMNRKQLREYGRMINTKFGNFTKQSLGKRKRKRRALKKVGNETRKLQRNE